ncbi:hypothetical protein DFH07DRAFT_776490 [Mycena maculata]|uniref:HTH CENPB-type domain-containing protein n=1 Tax=Mycena maculata TaxID=230809 RepID=A0AAD7ILY8_9AGAR|nr:hypothetical protein DFH07DRAFT_776490 [Mycena maculata]
MSTDTQSNVPLDPLDPATATGVAADLDLQDVNIELRYKWAITAVQDRGLSSRKAAGLYRLPRSTLDTHLKGVKSRREAHEHQRVLGPAQEGVLVEWVKIMGRWGLPLSLETIGNYAADIVGAPLGETWLRRFKVILLEMTT